MPPVIIGVVAAVATYGVTSSIVKAIIVGVIMAVAMHYAMPEIPDMGVTAPEEAQKTIRSADQPLRGIYGEAVVSGPIIFAEEHAIPFSYDEDYRACRFERDHEARGGQGRSVYRCETRTRTINTTHTYLHLVVPVAGHEVNSITEVYFGDELQEDWNHDYWKINVVLGGQTSIDDLPAGLRAVPSWTDTMIGKGVAFVHVMLRHSTTHFPNGIPNIKARVQGRKVNTPMATGFSRNVAACIYDYLVYHFKATAKMINLESFQNEYAICNEVMSEESDPLIEGGNPIRYAMDGYFDYDQTHSSVLDMMLAACAGKLNFLNGQYYLQVGAYRGPAGSSQKISLDDLTDKISVVNETPQEARTNTVTAKYLDVAGGFVTGDMPKVTNAAYVTEDSGQEFVKDLNLQYVSNVSQALRIANITLKDARYGRTLEVPLNWRGYKYNLGLNVGFDDPSLGFDDMEFAVVNWKVSVENGITLGIKQTSPDIYDDAVQTVSPNPPPSALPNPKFTAPVTNVTYTPTPENQTYDGTLFWSHPDLANIDNYFINCVSSEGEVFQFQTKDTYYRFTGFAGLTYNVSVIAQKFNGSPSEPVTVQLSLGATKAITGVTLTPKNFEVLIEPAVDVLPLNTTFIFFRGDTEEDVYEIGRGVTYTDSGLISDTPYNYWVQVTNGGSVGQLYGPYATRTTNNPDEIIDVIQPALPGKVWIVYASDPFGADISVTYDPNLHKYEGRAYNKRQDSTPTLNPADYQFYQIDGYISDEERTILDNLAEGKMPDGNGTLIKREDVLFEVGDKVQTEDIEVGAVENEQIAVDAVTGPKIKNGSVTGDKIPTGTIVEDKIAVDAVTGPKIKNGSVTGDKIPTGAIVEDKIAVDAVTGPKIKNGSVTGDKIPTGTIVEDKIAVDAVTGPKIASEAVTTNKLSAQAVTAEKIAVNTITAQQIAANTLTANEIAANAITASELAADSVTAAKIDAGAVTADAIASEAVTTNKLDAQAVTAEKIAVNTITAQQIAANTLTANEIAANAITASELAADSVTAAKIDAGAVTADAIASEAVTTNKLDAQAVTAEKIAVNTITAQQIAANAITTSELSAQAVTAEKIKTNTITATQIAVETITANEIASGAIGTDKLVANSVTTAKIDAGAVTATEIAANAVTASKILAGSITTDKIQAQAISTEKIAAAVVSPLNNFSTRNDLIGWSGSGSIVSSVDLNGNTVRTLRMLPNSSDQQTTSTEFRLDGNGSYEMTASLYCASPNTTQNVIAGLRVKDKDGNYLSMTQYHPTTGAELSSSTYADFYSGTPVGWIHMIAYLIGQDADPKSFLGSKNAAYTVKIPSDAVTCEVRFVSIGGGSKEAHFYSPSVVKVGSGKIVANEIVANSSIQSPTIIAGNIEASQLTFVNDSAIPDNINNDLVEVGSNLVPSKYTNATTDLDPQVISGGPGLVSLGWSNNTPAGDELGIGSMRITKNSNGEAYVHYTDSLSNYNITVRRNSKHIVSAYIYSDNSGSAQFYLKTASGTYVGATITLQSGVWKRYSAVLDLANTDSDRVWLRIDNDVSGDNTIYINNIQVEVADGGTVPTKYKQGVPDTYADQTPYEIKSKNYVPGSDGWIIKEDGTAEFLEVEVRGTLYAGDIVGGVGTVINGPHGTTGFIWDFPVNGQNYNYGEEIIEVTIPKEEFDREFLITCDFYKPTANATFDIYNRTVRGNADWNSMEVYVSPLVSNGSGGAVSPPAGVSISGLGRTFLDRLAFSSANSQNFLANFSLTWRIRVDGTTSTGNYVLGLNAYMTAGSPTITTAFTVGCNSVTTTIVAAKVNSAVNISNST